MTIYGTTVLSVCLLIGMLSGDIIALAIGVDGNVGGVGLAMLILIAVVSHLQKTGRFNAPSATGIMFWSSIYVPIVVAMSASQDVVRAISSGTMAVVAGLLSVLVCYALFLTMKMLADPAD